MPTASEQGALPAGSVPVRRRGSGVAVRDVGLLRYCQAISVDVGAGRLLHVGNQGRAGFVAGRGYNLAHWYSRQVSQQELLGRREAKRHPDVVDNDVAKPCVLEKPT